MTNITETETRTGFSDQYMTSFGEAFRIVIQTRWDNQEKIFLLTAFDLRKKPE